MANKLSISKGRSDVHRINVDDLHIDLKNNGRRFSPSDDKVRSLAESIIEYGQLEPIIIRKVADNTYTPVAGYTRCAAIRLINTDPELRAKANLAEGESFLIKATSIQVSQLPHS
jgi:ParB-like chromosome segregation protein Spo0J